MQLLAGRPTLVCPCVGVHRVSFTSSSLFHQQVGSPLKLVDQFTYLGSNISSIVYDVNTHIAKVWNAIDRLSITWKSDLSDKIKPEFIQAVAVSVLLYGCTTYVSETLRKNLDGNYTRTLRAVFNRFLKLHPTKQQLYEPFNIYIHESFVSTRLFTI